MRVLLNKFIANEDGATAIEYGLIAALIAVVIIGVVGEVGGKVQAAFQAISDGLG
jgi:pilus assembly protein Flp/PilA